MTETPRRPRIVFLCQRVPYPPDRGDRITTWNFLRHFVQRGADVAVGCLQEEARDADAVAHLRTHCRAVAAPSRSPKLARALGLRGLLTGEPLTLPVFRRRALHAAVRSWCTPTPPDLIWVYSSSMAQYALDVPARVKVMQFAELDSDKWRQYAAAAGPAGRWLYGREARLLLAYEDRVARAFDRSLVVSEVERELFRRRIPGVEPAVLPNGVDVAHFQSRGDADRHAHTAIFTGVMDYEPNVDGVCWFVDHCWPALRERFPDARLLVVGSRPNARVAALARVHRLPPPRLTDPGAAVARWFADPMAAVVAAASSATASAAAGAGPRPCAACDVDTTGRPMLIASSTLFCTPRASRSGAMATLARSK